MGFKSTRNLGFKLLVALAVFGFIGASEDSDKINAQEPTSDKPEVRLEVLNQPGDKAVMFPRYYPLSIEGEFNLGSGTYYLDAFAHPGGAYGDFLDCEVDVIPSIGEYITCDDLEQGTILTTYQDTTITFTTDIIPNYPDWSEQISIQAAIREMDNPDWTDYDVIIINSNGDVYFDPRYNVYLPVLPLP